MAEEAATAASPAVEETQPVQVADVFKFCNHLKKLVPALLEDADESGAALSALLKDPVRLDVIRKFLSDPQTPALLVRRLSNKGTTTGNAGGWAAPSATRLRCCASCRLSTRPPPPSAALLLCTGISAEGYGSAARRAIALRDGRRRSSVRLNFVRKVTESASSGRYR